MKKTAVEWLKVTVKAMIENGGDADLHAVLWHIEQTKEMEKAQMIDAWSNGWLNDYQSDEDVKNSAEHYYNETFNTKEK